MQIERSTQKLIKEVSSLTKELDIAQPVYFNAYELLVLLIGHWTVAFQSVTSTTNL